MPAPTTREQAHLLATLQERFDLHPQRHPGIAWADVLARFKSAPSKIASLHEMERTGGEPDVTGRDSASGAFLFCDCSPQTPAGRTGLCYDKEAMDSRKANKPAGNVIDTAAAMGIRLLDEDQYRTLQSLGEFDTKTSSWILTPPEIRRLGGALFCDRRYGRVFTSHNGAQSWFGARGFRGMIAV